MEATSGAAASQAFMPSETQQAQNNVSVEQDLFDYMLELEKGLGATGQFNDPSALLGSALEKVDGVAQGVQEAFEKARSNSAESAGNNAQGGDSTIQVVSQEGTGEAPAGSNQDMSATLDRVISVLWASAHASMAVNGMSAASSSANTLIKQQ